MTGSDGNAAESAPASRRYAGGTQAGQFMLIPLRDRLTEFMQCFLLLPSESLGASPSRRHDLQVTVTGGATDFRAPFPIPVECQVLKWYSRLAGVVGRGPATVRSGLVGWVDGVNTQLRQLKCWAHPQCSSSVGAPVKNQFRPHATR